MAIPDWQLPTGVDRGLWDYLHATEMVAAYDEQMLSSPLAEIDIAFCEKAFPNSGRLIDLGCGTGRLSVHFAAKGYDCLGVDLSEEMLAKAKANWERTALMARTPLHTGDGELGFPPSFVEANLVDLKEFADASFDYSACLFSTLGMVRGDENRAKVIANTLRLLKPGGRLVLHVHNRYFGGLGWKRIVQQAAKSLFGVAGDIAMPQSYGGAPLTLHHFTRREAERLLAANGFKVLEVLAFGLEGLAARPWWRVYGWLILAVRPS